MSDQKNKIKVQDDREDLREHVRDGLEQVMKTLAEKERKEAEKLYITMLKNEKELKTILKDKFKLPSGSPSKNEKVDYQRFKETVKENSLTKAILKDFGKNHKAAWEYLTLKTSSEKLKALNNPEKEVAASTEKKRRDGRFEAKSNPGADAAQGGSTEPEQGNQKTIIDVRKTDKPEPEGATPQAPSVPIESTAEHIQHAHVLGIFPDLPRADSPEDGSQDDSKILQLLWSHQDYFDQKALSRAQAEYNFLRVLEKERKSAEKRLTLEEIPYPKFTLKMFMEFPKTRYLYAVILTILEQSKDKKPGEAAAEEYFRLSVLEQTMIQQKLITAIPQGIDLDSAHYKELYQDMKTRFKSSGSQAQLRQAAEFKMIPLFEYLKLKETISQQRKQIEELASRLSGIASQQLAEGDAGFTDLGDKNRPQKLGERFAELFDETWSSAYESLRPKKEGEEEESDEKTMDLLQNVVKVIYEFCLKVSQEQIEKLVGGMIPPIVNPMNTAESKEFQTTADAIRTKTEHMAKEYRKVVAPATIKVLQKEIYEKELKPKLLSEPVGNEVQKYVQQCVDLIWYMCIQQPAMEIVWAKPGEKFNREQFRFSGKKGKTYKLTVWPAVFLHKDGPLVAPGYAVPE